MDLTTIITGLLGIGISVIGFFIKRDLKNIFSKLDEMVTKDACKAKYDSCHQLHEKDEIIVDERRKRLIDRLDALVEDFEELSKCLKVYTKGECP